MASLTSLHSHRSTVPRPASTPAAVGRQAAAGARLRAVRVSRCVRERLAAGCRSVVIGTQRRACHLAVDGGPLLILSGPDVGLAPNGLSLDVAPHARLGDVGFHVGERVWLGPAVPTGDAADWLVTVDSASTWDPRPAVHRLRPHDLIDRLRVVRAAVVAEGIGESLLPLLWTPGSDADGLRSALVRT